MSENNPISATPEKAAPVFAGFWIRLAATLFDTALFLAVFFPLSFRLEAMAGPGGRASRFVVTWLLPAVITLAFWRTQSATPGKHVFGLRIQDENTGGAPSLGRLVIRYLGYYLSFLVLCVGYLWVAADKKKRAWHDRFARTVVVREPVLPSRRRGWITALAAIVLVEIVGAAIFVPRYLKKNSQALLVQANQAKNQGRAYALGKVDMDCVRTTLARDAEKSTLQEHAASVSFLEGCLETAGQSPGFCNGVPSESDVFKTGRWRAGACQALGRTDAYCGPLFGPVQKHCHPETAS